MNGSSFSPAEGTFHFSSRESSSAKCRFLSKLTVGPSSTKGYSIAARNNEVRSPSLEPDDHTILILLLGLNGIMVLPKSAEGQVMQRGNVLLGCFDFGQMVSAMKSQNFEPRTQNKMLALCSRLFKVIGYHPRALAELAPLLQARHQLQQPPRRNGKSRGVQPFCSAASSSRALLTLSCPSQQYSLPQGDVGPKTKGIQTTHTYERSYTSADHLVSANGGRALELRFFIQC